MNIVLLSGGSGKRLWPLSNETRSKQFLKLLKNGNERESMVQRVLRQLKNTGMDANIVVATSKAQVDSVRNQLGNAVDIVVEPERRDTFPAIILASAYLSYEKKLSDNEVVLVLPVDPYAEADYFTTLLKMEQLVLDDVAKIALMGIKPSHASDKFGHIITKDGLLVERFQEKPAVKMAEQLMSQGALWNGGVFAFRLGYLMDVLDNHISAYTFEDVYNQYGILPKISFDYEIVEKESSMAVVEYSGIWSDLGTWSSLTEVMEDTAIGHVVKDDTCCNTHVINELDTPIIVLGAKNTVVVASPDGILVADKHQSSYLKTFVDAINQQPMFEEFIWGNWRVFECMEYIDGFSSVTKNVFVKANQSIPYQAHAQRDEIWTIIDGKGELLIDGCIHNVTRGDVINIAKGQKHAIRALSDLQFIEVQVITGPPIQSDYTLFDWNWE